MLNSFRGQGVTRIRTRRQNARIFSRFLLFLLGFAVSLYVGSGLASLVTGPGWRHPVVHLRSLFTGTGPVINLVGKHPSARHFQFPAVLVLPAPWLVTLAGAAPLLIGWLLVARTGVFHRRRHVGPERHRGLASVKAIRELFGSKAVRAAGAFTMPGASRWARMWLPTNSFGYHVGSPLEPRVKGMRLWFNFETRLRIIARSGWGKSWRLLIPIIRELPGAAVVTSVEAEIFTATVKARMWRRPPVRFRWMRLLRPTWRRHRRFPVFVADLSAPESRFAAGFPLVRWNPIVGAEHFKMATARARALVSGGDSNSGQDSGTDKFFRDSATQVLAAWLQAAAMDPTKDIEDLIAWLRTTDLATPESILQNAATQEATTAVMNMITHLDPAAGRTTSGVKRYLNFAIASLASGQGRALCGPRSGPQFDMDHLISGGGTVYLLAEPEEMELARPILTLVAQEMFLAAERIARRLPGRRHRQTFMGVFDELFAGVRMPLLPYVASVQRKYGISYCYAIQSSSDEDELFGKTGAQRLRNQSVTVVGGYDSDSAQETARRAGRAGVVSRSRHLDGGGSEHTQLEDVLPESDQQKLKNGQSIVLGLGIAPFLAMTERIDHSKAARIAINQQMREVEAFVARRRDRALIDTTARDLYDRDPAAVLDLT